jgi:mannose-6-phosphate isomerase-like protein (cupin superfamily)
VIVRKEAVETMRKRLFNGQGEVRIDQLFTPGEFSARVRLCARLIIEPGGDIGLHRHQGEDEIYFVLSGKAVVSDGGSESTVAPGDSVLTVSGESHSIRNTGVEDLVLLALIPQSPTP